MFLKRFYEEKLAQASYLLGCEATGQALVVDANRNAAQYAEEAARHRSRITHVTETHIHADYVSGVRELAARTGARIYLSGEGGPEWRYAYAEDAGAELLADGDTFRVGNVRVDALHTPGHTPEHLTFLVTDGAAADRPMGAFTGDFIFVGDVGRPDLLERAAGVGGTMDPAARELFRSLQRFRDLPDYLQIWPAHGAGSACGKAMGAVPQSTLGYEKLFNWAFAIPSEAAFVQAVLEGQPEPPKYFARMKRINREGPRVLDGFPRPERLPDSRLAHLLEAAALVVDLRHHADFAAGHVPGAISIPLNSASFTAYAGWLLPYDRDFYLIAPRRRGAEGVNEAVSALTLIGFDRVAGYFYAGAVESWAAEGRPLETVPAVAAAELVERMRAGSVTVIDVRWPAEWEAGCLPEVPNIPLGYLPDRLDQIPRDRPVVLHCRTGVRSVIAASLLQAAGFRNILNLPGGFEDWRARGYPVEGGAGERAGPTSGR
ncbi:MAG: MBL fold metallo-hydrolase [Gemmatimonadetes bacterium]|nr:MBL fold metallo-hydrolase [Gemmatimonadota bacterium]